MLSTVYCGELLLYKLAMAKVSGERSIIPLVDLS